ncbi:dynein regulatory complex protein 8-like [Stegodyphus dumicola]|uniref:dynein regulatory complex protein 8-like n=1 Tax=Stegodyphus dumicola TaxID=202533 RepID=UPI0015AE0166|nr:dynein regulatory complex protein 8-like [Stegodyphus dumicola]
MSKSMKRSPYEVYTQKQVRAAFEVFDEDRKGRAKIKHLGTIVRALGRVPTSNELQELTGKVEDPETPGYMQKEKILPELIDYLMKDKWKSSSKEVLLQAFQVFDRDGKGFLEREYFRKLLLQYGDSFEEDSIDTFLDEATDPIIKKINYIEFCDKLVAPEVFDIVQRQRKLRKEIANLKKENRNKNPYFV